MSAVTAGRGERQKQRGRQGDRDRGTARETETETQRDRDRGTARETETKTKTHRERTLRNLLSMAFDMTSFSIKANQLMHKVGENVQQSYIPHLFLQ